ncbi:MAG: hypothetical protein IJU78_04900 [Clostridia bacterium]|nr:hypothetical protein [Clostridia bacterium]
MATLRGVIERVDEIKPNAFSAAAKTAWLNECEGMVQTEVILLALCDVIQYDYAADSEKVLLAEPPHDKIYWTYLCALIDFANGEYNKYHNTMQLFNAYFGEYMRWYARRYRPADGRGEERGYYISAYAIAVKHGYEGTEEEWLASLHGEAGPKGDKGEKGDKGDKGDAGTMDITPESGCTVTGLLKGASGAVTAAVEGEDYIGVSGGKALPRRISTRTESITADELMLDSTESGRIFLCRSARSMCVTLLPDPQEPLPAVYDADAEIELVRMGTGEVEIAAASGVTLYCAAEAPYMISGQYESACLKHIGPNTWLLQGAIE